MYSLNYIVTTSACDSEGRLKLYSALQMMQDCSEMWIDSELGVKQFFTEQNMTQLLATRQVEIIRVPEFKEKLTVTTSVYGMKPMFGFRNTFIYDERGKPCYKTWSMSAFVDKSSGKGMVMEPVKVLRADIDYNKHLNNANYVRMAMELLPEGFNVKGLRVEYRIAAKLGDVLTPTIYKTNACIIVALSIGGEVSAIIEFSD